jgi:heme/copper-type cytochrome/quinol oxidase subunit 3
VLATALVTILASYFYLGGNVRPGGESAPVAPAGQAGVATLLLLAGVVPMALALRAIRRERSGLLRATVVATLALAALHFWLLLDALFGSGLAPAMSGRDTAFVGVAGFHAITTFALLVMLLVAVLWVLLRPQDGRGFATVWNASAVYFYTAASGLVTYVALYLVPRWG